MEKSDNLTVATVEAKEQKKISKPSNKKQFKNQELQEQLTATLMKSVHVSDPTSVSTIKLGSSVAPACVPITFRALPKLVHQLWLRMRAIGPRSFGILATDANYAIFLKTILILAEAKLSFAQMKCVSPPSMELVTGQLYTEMELRILTSLPKSLPYPITKYLESIGNFTVDNQNVVPYLPLLQPTIVSGCITYAPSHIRSLLAGLANPVVATNATVTAARAIDDLPMVQWDEVLIPQRQGEAVVNVAGLQATPASIAFWGERIPSAAERTTFRQLISAMDSKRGFNFHSSIEHGEGSIVQVVRFPEQYDPNEIETLYYSNVPLPASEEQLAPALMLGFEYGVPRHSRFMTGYDASLIRGTASQDEALRALIWTKVD